MNLSQSKEIINPGPRRINFFAFMINFDVNTPPRLVKFVDICMRSRLVFAICFRRWGGAREGPLRDGGIEVPSLGLFLRDAL